MAAARIWLTLLETLEGRITAPAGVVWLPVLLANSDILPNFRSKNGKTAGRGCLDGDGNPVLQISAAPQ